MRSVVSSIFSRLTTKSQKELGSWPYGRAPTPSTHSTHFAINDQAIVYATSSSLGPTAWKVGKIARKIRWPSADILRGRPPNYTLLCATNYNPAFYLMSRRLESWYITPVLRNVRNNFVLFSAPVCLWVRGPYVTERQTDRWARPVLRPTRAAARC